MNPEFEIRGSKGRESKMGKSGTFPFHNFQVLPQFGRGAAATKL